MDASRILRKQGWRGLGYSLDKKDRGIKHPLMIKYKDNTLGLGKEVRTLPSDQWWMRAFDESLTMMGTGESTALSRAAAKGTIGNGGLFTFFVRGEGLEGTIQRANEEAARLNKKRKHESITEHSPEPSTDSSDEGTGKEERKEKKKRKKDEKRDKKEKKKSKRDTDGGANKGEGVAEMKRSKSKTNRKSDPAKDTTTLHSNSDSKETPPNHTHSESHQSVSIPTPPISGDSSSCGSPIPTPSGSPSLCLGADSKKLVKLQARADKRGVALAVYLARLDRKKRKRGGDREKVEKSGSKERVKAKKSKA